MSIADIHPDFYYRPRTTLDEACHRGKGPAGYYGLEGSECDSPFSLANETFRWIDENLKDDIDFIIWTGDSARHDSDEEIPREEWEIVRLNELMVNKFVEVFGIDEDSSTDAKLSIPIVPTIGNNDMMPHNIFKVGPNVWTKRFVSIWDRFIPEEQRHAFIAGGWFTSELIPGKLAAISLNTMYFFDSNPAVDGCDAKSEPGYEHMEWLRVQLQLLRERDMKVILIGHVPPARSGSKVSWEESCWQKYTLWVHQYRDIIVGSLYGHMNIDHFMLQDSRDISIAGAAEDGDEPVASNDPSITSRSGYLSSLRQQWSKLPSPPEDLGDQDGSDYFPEYSSTDAEKSARNKEKFLKKIGGPFAERYSVSLVSPSVVPNYFPTLRVMEYNITGLEDSPTWVDRHSSSESVVDGSAKKRKKNKKNKKKKKKEPSFTVPEPPSATAPAGPAYSNQALSWLRYTQYYANLTRINEQYGKSDGSNGGFEYEVEYDTKLDHVYRLKDLTVRSFFKLASRMADGGSTRKALAETDQESAETQHQAYEIHDGNEEDEKALDDGKNGGKKQDKKNRTWVTFLSRAFVGYLDADEVNDELNR